MRNALLAVLCVCPLSLGCAGDDTAASLSSDAQLSGEFYPDAGVSSPNDPQPTGGDAGAASTPPSNPSPAAGDASVASSDAGAAPAGDAAATSTPPGAPVVPDDPTICSACTDNSGCPASGSRTYMCISAWYQPSGGAKVEEQYCARRCETEACPASFACQELSNPPTKVCIPQPNSVCALLGK